ncbi:MAG TPA: serine O-acetyltransferase, partial [Agitococcus sp.]|nr:serine O-acetyltransferase [Agitococcus sp.]
GVTLGGTTWQKGKRHPTLEDGVVVGAGAKVLGPFTVGKGAKIGSNAVVTKAVPDGATAVGNPARLILKQVLEVHPDEQARLDFAQKIGFQAYAATPDLPDPVVEALRVLLDHMQATDKRLDKMCGALKRVNKDFCDERPEELKAEDLAVMQENGQ